MKLRYILFSLGLFLAFSGCKEDPAPEPTDSKATVKVRLEAYFEDQPFSPTEVYTNVSDYRIRVEHFKLYLSKLELVKSDGTSLRLMDIDMVNMLEDEGLYTFRIDPGSFQSLNFGIGVPFEWNKDQDPTQYPNDHPLSVNGAEGMFWTWNTGYIFIGVEGKADLQGQEGNALLDPFAFHCGEDQLYRTHAFPVAFTLDKGDSRTFTIRFQVDKFFYNDSDTIDIAIDNLTHTGGNLPLAQRFTNLFNEAIIVQ